MEGKLASENPLWVPVILPGTFKSVVSLDSPSSLRIGLSLPTLSHTTGKGVWALSPCYPPRQSLECLVPQPLLRSWQAIHTGPADKELATTGQLTLAISLELREGIWEVTLVAGQDPGDPVPKLWSQSSKAGGGAGGKSIREEGPGSREEADSGQNGISLGLAR